MARNQLGGFYEPGKPLPLDIREKMYAPAQQWINELSRAMYLLPRDVSPNHSLLNKPAA